MNKVLVAVSRRSLSTYKTGTKSFCCLIAQNKCKQNTFNFRDSLSNPQKRSLSTEDSLSDALAAEITAIKNEEEDDEVDEDYLALKKKIQKHFKIKDIMGKGASKSVYKYL
jgi:hypothetical protein